MNKNKEKLVKGGEGGTPFYKRWDYIVLVLATLLGIAMEKSVNGVIFAMPFLVGLVIAVVRVIQSAVKKDKKYLSMAKPMAIISAVSFIIFAGFADLDDVDGEDKEDKVEEVEEVEELEDVEELEEIEEEVVEEEVVEEEEEEVEISEESKRKLYLVLLSNLLKEAYEGTAEVDFIEEESRYLITPTDPNLKYMSDLLELGDENMVVAWGSLRDVFVEESTEIYGQGYEDVKLAIIDPKDKETKIFEVKDGEVVFDMYP